MMTSGTRLAGRRLPWVIAAAVAFAIGWVLISGYFGTETAGAAKPGGGGPPAETDFEKVTLTRDVGEPMALAVLPDRRVLHTSRTGEVRLYDPQTKVSRVINRLDLYQHDEEGLQSIAIDPNFARNNWVYLYYSPPQDTPTGDAPNEGTAADFAQFEGEIFLSRFKFTGGSLDLSTEQKILEVPVDRGICCHVGGKIDFDNQGNLYLSTGDDTNPFASQGYTPIDERPNRNPAYDAQRTSANTNDLRGKVLRIKPTAGGSYTIPRGNLFPEANDTQDKTRPEIYAMGLRNPFRFAVDPATGYVYLGDYSPDAGTADPNRGPAGQGEWQVIKTAGNYGWPYCGGNNLPYNDYDFATGVSGPKFSCANPVNESPNNTGLTNLPPARPADMYYSYSESAEFPELGTGGIGPMGGPVYKYNAGLNSSIKFPKYYDGTAFFYEWTRDYIKAIKLGRGASVQSVQGFMPNTVFDNPMDMEFGPDGAMYVLEYGDGFFTQNPEAQLSRVEATQGNLTPVAQASADPSSGPSPLTVQFSSQGSYDPEGAAVTYAWDFQSDGTTDSTEANPTFTYNQDGTYNAQVAVTDAAGKTGVATVNVRVGTAPVVNIVQPPDGGFFNFGDAVPFTIEGSDGGGPLDCSQVRVNYVLGHDSHGHPLTNTTGCSGVLQTIADDGHGDDANVFGVIAVTYESASGETVDDEVILQPRHKQAEFFTASSGSESVARTPTADTSGGQDVTAIENGDWISYSPMNLQNINSMTFRVDPVAGGTIEVRAGAPDGPLVGSATVPADSSNAYVDVSTPVTNPGGTQDLYLVFTNASGAGQELFKLNYIDFNGTGVAAQ